MSSQTKTDTAAAVNRVLELLGKPTTATAAAGGSVLPTARVRTALEVFAQAGTIEELDAQQVNLKALVKDLLDWDNKPGEVTRANGNVVKAVATVLQARDERGLSLYPQGVEMLGFAAAVAPLLQPDRIARLIGEAPKVATAFGPDRYTVRFASAAEEILTRYPEQRRETLLVSLWHAIHTGRFWDVTSGVTALETAAVRRVRDREEQEAREEIVRRALDGHDAGSREAHAAVTRGLLDQTLPYNAGTAALVAQLPPTPVLRDGLVRLAGALRAGEVVHPDTVMLMTHIPWARPDERPESPIGWSMRQVTDALRPDRETGEALLEDLPKKPKSWRELYPDEDLSGFPHPPAARALHGRPLPGAAGVTMEVVRNAAELNENGTYMGNCTAGYKRYMEEGAYVLLKLTRGLDRYNASLVAYHAGDQWRIGEVNSRFNAGNVPDDIRQAVTAIAAQMPPREERPGARRQRLREARSARFRVAD